MLVHVGTAGLHVGLDTGENASAHLTILLQHIYRIDPAIVVILAEIPPLGLAPGNALYAAYNASMPGIVAQQQAAGQQISLVHPGVLLSETVDLVHPSPAGYVRIADAFYGALLDMLQVQCSMSQRIAVQVVKVPPDRLQVTVTARGPGNAIQMISFGRRTNVQNVGGLALSNRTLSQPTATFTMQRTAPGPMMLAFIVTDGCGDWPTFAGAGPF